MEPWRYGVFHCSITEQIWSHAPIPRVERTGVALFGAEEINHLSDVRIKRIQEVPQLARCSGEKGLGEEEQILRVPGKEGIEAYRNEVHRIRVARIVQQLFPGYSAEPDCHTAGVLAVVGTDGRVRVRKANNGVIGAGLFEDTYSPLLWKITFHNELGLDEAMLFRMQRPKRFSGRIVLGNPLAQQFKLFPGVLFLFGGSIENREEEFISGHI